MRGIPRRISNNATPGSGPIIRQPVYGHVPGLACRQIGCECILGGYRVKGYVKTCRTAHYPIGLVTPILTRAVKRRNMIMFNNATYFGGWVRILAVIR